MLKNKLKKLLVSFCLISIASLPLIASACNAPDEGYVPIDERPIPLIQSTTKSNQQVIRLRAKLKNTKRNNSIFIYPGFYEKRFLNRDYEDENIEKKYGLTNTKNMAILGEPIKKIYAQIYNDNKKNIFRLVNSKQELELLDLQKRVDDPNLAKLKNRLLEVDFNKNSIFVIYGLHNVEDFGSVVTRKSGYWVDDLIVTPQNINIKLKYVAPREIKKKQSDTMHTAIPYYQEQYMFFVIIDKINSLDGLEINYEII